MSSAMLAKQSRIPALQYKCNRKGINQFWASMSILSLKPEPTYATVERATRVAGERAQAGVGCDFPRRWLVFACCRRDAATLCLPWRRSETRFSASLPPLPPPCWTHHLLRPHSPEVHNCAPPALSISASLVLIIRVFPRSTVPLHIFYVARELAWQSYRDHY